MVKLHSLWDGGQEQMAKRNLDAEELFRKSEDEMSDIEKMMAEILNESGDEAPRASSEGTGESGPEKNPAYASPAPPARAKKSAAASSSGGRVEKAVPDRGEAGPSARQSRTQKAEREKNIKEAAKKRSLMPMIAALAIIAVFVVGALVYTKMFEDIRAGRGAVQTGTAASAPTAGENETDEAEGTAEQEVSFPPDMVIPTPEPAEAVAAGNITVVPPPDPIVILSDTRTTPEPEAESGESSAAGEGIAGESQAPRQHTYQFFKDDVSWTQAQQACRDLGGYLAVVSSEEELQSIISLAQQNGIEKVWLGCHRENGELVWENGETVTFYVWGNGEPSLYDSGDRVAEDYLLLWRFNGAWVYNDSRNDPVSDYPGMYSGQIGYVCEFDS